MRPSLGSICVVYGVSALVGGSQLGGEKGLLYKGLVYRPLKRGRRPRTMALALWARDGKQLVSVHVRPIVESCAPCCGVPGSNMATARWTEIDDCSNSAMLGPWPRLNSRFAISVLTFPPQPRRAHCEGERVSSAAHSEIRVRLSAVMQDEECLACSSGGAREHTTGAAKPLT